MGCWWSVTLYNFSQIQTFLLHTIFVCYCTLCELCVYYCNEIYKGFLYFPIPTALGNSYLVLYPILCPQFFFIFHNNKFGFVYCTVVKHASFTLCIICTLKKSRKCTNTDKYVHLRAIKMGAAKNIVIKTKPNGTQFLQHFTFETVGNWAGGKKIKKPKAYGFIALFIL